jgi:hypothetical protein
MFTLPSAFGMLGRFVTTRVHLSRGVHGMRGSGQTSGRPLADYVSFRSVFLRDVAGLKLETN